MYVIEEAIRVFGAMNQRRIAIEELSELIKELCKYERYGDNIDHIAEEIADCEIMLQQLVEMFNLYEAVAEWRFEKMERLRCLIEKKMAEGV